jgi:hypothetical protein
LVGDHDLVDVIIIGFGFSTLLWLTLMWWVMEWWDVLRTLFLSYWKATWLGCRINREALMYSVRTSSDVPPSVYRYQVPGSTALVVYWDVLGVVSRS